MSNSFDNFINGINQAQNAINTIAGAISSNNQQSNSFNLPASPQSSSNGLPAFTVNENRDSSPIRNIITWFVPQYGMVKMYVNPESISYNKSKAITPERTKGGYTLQYWGEQLETLVIQGTTGSSGIEGINVLEQIYRAEQLMMDAESSILISSSVNNSNALSNIINTNINSNPLQNGILGALSALTAPDVALAPAAINSLAQSAFTIEMYYNGVVYRGFFTTFNVTEAANNFCINYTMNFTVTQKRGYRTNYFPFQRSPKAPSSDYSEHSFSGYVK